MDILWYPINFLGTVCCFILHVVDTFLALANFSKVSGFAAVCEVPTAHFLFAVGVAAVVVESISVVTFFRTLLDLVAADREAHSVATVSGAGFVASSAVAFVGFGVDACGATVGLTCGASTGSVVADLSCGA